MVCGMFQNLSIIKGQVCAFFIQIPKEKLDN